jgi:hypothetical protein
MRVYLDANGPRIDLFKEDVVALRNRGYLCQEFLNRDAIMRLRIKNQHFNNTDPFCPGGFMIRRFPEEGGQHDYKGRQSWALWISKGKFEEILKLESEDNSIYIHARCKYDRFTIGIHLDL